MVVKRKSPFRSIHDVYDESRKRILDSIINLDTPKEEEVSIVNAYDVSRMLLRSYVTLDSEHVKDIKDILVKIQQYSLDPTQRRPLNFLMSAEPGSGKSHFVKCIAEKLRNRNVRSVTYNMATFQKPEDFIHPIEAVRNLKIQDKLPILFIDEFDSDEKNYPFLLPLLWDGEIQLTNRDLKLGKIVIILAASKSEIKKVIYESKKMERASSEDKSSSKLKDLVSRINGGDFEIPNLDLVKGKRDRRIDKICLSVSLLQQRFGYELQLIPWAFLKFIATTEFRYGVRSITQLIDLIPYPEDFTKTISVSDLNLPLNSISDLKKSSLSYHLISTDADDGIEGIIEKWSELKTIKTLVRISTEDDDLPF
jgi:hypothetical protein